MQKAKEALNGNCGMDFVGEAKVRARVPIQYYLCVCALAAQIFLIKYYKYIT